MKMPFWNNRYSNDGTCDEVVLVAVDASLLVLSWLDGRVEGLRLVDLVRSNGFLENGQKGSTLAIAALDIVSSRGNDPCGPQGGKCGRRSLLLIRALSVAGGDIPTTT